MPTTDHPDPIIARILQDSEAHRQALALERREENRDLAIRVASACVASGALAFAMYPVFLLIPGYAAATVITGILLGAAAADFGIRPEDH